MAEETAALVVALSAQLTKFEKDMSQAVKIADKKTKEIEGKFGTMNKAVTTQLSIFTSAFGSNLGGLSGMLKSIGPAGLVAGAGIVAAGVALTGLVHATDEYVKKLGDLKDASETIGITATQLKALQDVGADVGLRTDQVTQAFSRFVAGLEDMKDAQGQLYPELLKIDRGLVAQLSSATSTAEAIEILAKAYAKLNTESEKAAFTKAIAGQRNLGVGRLFDELNARGGFQSVVAQTRDINEQARKFDQIADAIAKVKRDTQDLFGEAFAPEILAASKTVSENIKSISEWLNRVTTESRENGLLWLFGRAIDLIKRFNEERAKFGLGGGEPLKLTVNKPAIPFEGPEKGGPAPKPTTAQELDQLRALIGLLGQAATIEDQRRIKILEINVALEQGKIKQEGANQAISAANAAAATEIQQLREKIGVATAENISTERQAQLTRDLANIRATDTEKITAQIVKMKEAKEAADQMAIRQSYFPGLKQLELDASNLNKGLDQLATGSLKAVEDGFVDVIAGTKTLADAFRDMVSSILKELARLLVRQSIIGPLAQLLGIPAGGGGGVQLFAPGNAGGTKNWGGGWTWVGEKGPELVNLPKGSQVVPNEVARGGVGGVSVGVTSTIVVQGDASERTLMLIEGALARQKRELPNDIIKTVNQMRSRRA